MNLLRIALTKSIELTNQPPSVWETEGTGKA